MPFKLASKNTSNTNPPEGQLVASASLILIPIGLPSAPLAPDYFKGLWSRFKRRSMLLEKDQTLYSFRHTGAIDIYKRTGSIEKLKAAMGHSNIMVSLTYLRGLDVAELKEEDMPKL
jgi:integrase